MQRQELEEYLKNSNVQAFLSVVRLGEGSNDAGGYKRMFGGGTFGDFSAHPHHVVTSTLWGKPISSSAAGAYQFLSGTWDELQAKYGFADFSPTSQDLGAVGLLARRGALDDICAGRFESAVAKCSKEWASLPGSPYGQPTLSMEKAKKAYDLAGGSYQQGDKPMTPFIMAAASALLESAPDLIRLFGKDGGKSAERNAQAAEKIVEIAKTVTGEKTAEGAVQVIQENPEVAAQFREEAYKQRLELADLAEKSVAAARDFNKEEPAVWGSIRFVHIVSLLFILFSGIGAVIVLATATFSAELKASVVTLMIVGGWTGVKEYWLGSSYGSLRKDERKD